MGEAKRQHYVPEFLLRPWLVDDAGENHLYGHHWANYPKPGKITVKRKGLKAFCNGEKLWSLVNHPRGRDAIERVFLGHVDNRAAVAADPHWQIRQSVR